MAFNYSITEKEGLVLLEMQGKLVDKAEAIDIGAEVEEQMASDHNHFIIDLSELEYMNSTGLNIILNLMNKCRNNGGEAVVAGSTVRIKSLFSVTKLDTVFTLKDSREEAVQHLKELSE
ncbi:STAS domain-containing protein [Cryomorphaceae bacterium 1068]|nr:STAS domain-containing protein [Cryomorphaceae bacterium 1068]